MSGNIVWEAEDFDVASAGRPLPPAVRRGRPPSALLGALAAALLAVACGEPTREEALAEAAKSLGLAYHDEATAELEAALRGLPSVAARPQNFFVRSLEGDGVAVVDWTSRRGPLKERDRDTQTLVAVRVGAFELTPFVWAEREDVGPEELRALGGVVPFSAAQAFSDRYLLAGPERAALRALFSGSKRERLELPRGLRVEAAGRWLVGYRRGWLLPPGEIPAMIAQVRGLAIDVTSP